MNLCALRSWQSIHDTLGVGGMRSGLNAARGSASSSSRCRRLVISNSLRRLEAPSVIGSP